MQPTLRRAAAEVGPGRCAGHPIGRLRLEFGAPERIAAVAGGQSPARLRRSGSGGISPALAAASFSFLTAAQISSR